MSRDNPASTNGAIAALVFDAVDTERPVSPVGELGVVRREPVPDVGIRRRSLSSMKLPQ